MKTFRGVAALAALTAGLIALVAVAQSPPSGPAFAPPAPATGDTPYQVPPAGPTFAPPATVPTAATGTMPTAQPQPNFLPPQASEPQIEAAPTSAAPIQIEATTLSQADLSRPAPPVMNTENVSGQSESNPTGRQEPAVSIEWIGPSAAKLGQPADYAVVVRNACRIAVQQVMIRVKLPESVTVVATEPKAIQENNVLMWEFGTMMPQQEKTMTVRMLCSEKGDTPCHAWVTFTGATSMKVRVREPKLLLKATAPEKAMVGEAAVFVLTVSNPGDHPTEHVKLHATLSSGLEHARGNKVDFDIGNLLPGETRSVQVICSAKSGGDQTCEASAEADGGLKVTDTVNVEVIMPRIDLEVSGPKLRYLDRKATYVFKVTNPGDATAANVQVTELLPPGFKFLSADQGGRHDFSTRTVSWFLGEIAPGQSREVQMDVLAVNPGEHQHKVVAQASRGLKAEAELLTRVEGLSAILLEVVDVEDPVEVNAETAYEVRVTNTGSKTETDIKLICTLPDEMELKAISAPQGLRYHMEGRDIVFDVLPRLAPRADAIYRVQVKCLAAGVVQFKTKLSSTNLTEPVHKDEATRIYQD